LAERWRLDVEAGVAWTPLLDEVRAAPYLGVGVSYAIPVGGARGRRGRGADAFAGAGPAGRAASRVRPTSRGSTPPSPPRRRFVSDAVAPTAASTAGSVTARRPWGSRHGRRPRHRHVAYEGSVVEILTGRSEEASGTAEVDFRWDGCRWVRTGLRY
jgi:hypothetical protein